jgi:hypothetical protein
MIGIQKYLLPVLLFLIVSCKKPYIPSTANINVNYLVVEGVINSGPDSTIIKLSRTILLSQTNVQPETNALVTVESNTNARYTLNEVSPGMYVVIGLNLPVNGQYRLHIVTSQGEEYRSDFSENKITPAIDSVGYTIQSTGLQFYVNTHDNTNNTRYYRWDYDETWSYFSTFNSVLYYKNQQVVPRPVDSLINACYKFATPSNSIFVGTSNNLSQDVINQLSLGYTDASTGKLTKVYSLHVKQYALTADAFNYWTLLKKNTEQLGSIFDVQPSANPGNIHCISNPNELVIGFVSVSTITTKRIFVVGSKLPFVTPPQSQQSLGVDCAQEIIYFNPTFTYNQRFSNIFAKGDTLLISYVANPGTNQLTGYSYASKSCVDCRVFGGTTIKPSYWP